MVKLRGDTLTGDLLNWQPPKVAAGFEEGVIRGNRIASQISQVVGLALKTSSMSRAEIASAMSAELGYPISENMLDNYASEGAESHRITLERFLALITVTQCTDLLGFIAKPYGMVVVDKKYADYILLKEIKQAKEEITRLETRIETKMRVGN